MSTKNRACRHIRATLKAMQDQGVFVTAPADAAPSLYCAVCEVSRPMGAHGGVKVPQP